jgi:hypothetical protein
MGDSHLTKFTDHPTMLTSADDFRMSLLAISTGFRALSFQKKETHLLKVYFRVP